MNNKLPKLKRTAIYLGGIFVASMPAIASADWTIKGAATPD